MSHTSTYRYCPRYLPSTYLCDYSCTDFSSFRKRTYRVHADFGGVPTLGSWFYCAPAGQPSWIACERFRHRPLNQITLKHWQALFTAAWQHPCQCLSRRGLLAGGFSCCGSASPDSLPPWSAVCSPAAPAPASNAVRAANGRVRDLGFKLGRQWWAAKYLSIPAKFKSGDFIREINQRAYLAWSWAVQMVTGTSTLSSDYKIFKQSCKVQRFNQRDKTKSRSFQKLSSADGDGDVDHELRLECCGCYF